MKVIDPISVSSTATHTRAGYAWYWNWDGSLLPSPANTLRFGWARNGDFIGLMLEPQRINLLLNNAAPVTQSISVTKNTTYTLSFYGTGNIVASGPIGGTPVTVTGTGQLQRVSRTFVATATDYLLLTISGEVSYAQLEAGDYASSVIPTGSSPATRPADVVSGTGLIYSNMIDARNQWAVGTTYALGDLVRYDKRIYQSLQAANTGHTPDEASSAWWVDTGPDNIWACLDRTVSTQSVGGGSEHYIALVLPVNVDAAAAMNLDVTGVGLVLGDGASFANYVYKSNAPSNVMLGGVRAGNVLTLVLNNSQNQPRIGELVFGTLKTIGSTQYGLTGQMIDYSRKEADDFGVVRFVERAYSKRLSASVMVPKADYNASVKTALSLRATPTVWAATDIDDFAEGAIVFAFLKDLSYEVSYPTQTLFSIELEGLI